MTLTWTLGKSALILIAESIDFWTDSKATVLASTLTLDVNRPLERHLIKV